MTKQTKTNSFEARTLQFIDQYWRPFVVVFIVFIIGGASYMGYGFYKERIELQAQEELFAIKKSIDTKVEGMGKELKKNPELLNKEFGEQLQKYDQFIKKNLSLNAAKMAAINKADLAMNFQDWSLAESTLSGVLNQAKEKSIFYGLVRTQLATVHFNQGQYAEAAQRLEEVVHSKNFNYLHPHVLLRLGLAYMKTGDTEKARAMFKRVEADYSETQAARQAKNYQKILPYNKGAQK